MSTNERDEVFATLTADEFAAMEVLGWDQLEAQRREVPPRDRPRLTKDIVVGTNGGIQQLRIGEVGASGAWLMTRDHSHEEVRR